MNILHLSLINWRLLETESAAYDIENPVKTLDHIGVSTNDPYAFLALRGMESAYRSRLTDCFYMGLLVDDDPVILDILATKSNLRLYRYEKWLIASGSLTDVMALTISGSTKEDKRLRAFCNRLYSLLDQRLFADWRRTELPDRTFVLEPR
jgi:hypothetical protein